MPRKFLTSLDMGQNQFIKPVVENLSGAPGTPVKGQLYMNTTDNTLYWWDGAQWIAAKAAAGATPAGTVSTAAIGDTGVVGVSTNFTREDHKHGMPAFGGSVVAENVLNNTASAIGSAVTLARSDHTHGTPPMPTHSQVGAPTADVAWGGFKLSSLGPPVAGTDAVTKDYTDNLVAGLSWKDPCRVATTANIGTLTGLTAIDGVTPVANDRILVKDQSSGQTNGIYLAQSGAWSRALDANTSAEIEGFAVFVLEGTAGGDKAYVCTTNAPITLDTTPLVIVQFGGGAAISAGAGLTGTTTFDVVGDTTITVTADQISRAALTGNVTAPAGSNATTIAAGVVANSMLATMAANTVKMNNTGGSATPTDVAVATARTALGAPGKFTQATIGGATSQVVTHNLNTQFACVGVFRTLTPWDVVDCDVEMTSVNTVTLRFAVAPATNEYSCVVVG